MLRDKLTSFSIKLGCWTFFAMFVYIFLSGAFLYKYGFLPQYFVLFLFIVFFLFGLGLLPPKFNKENIGGWLFFTSFMLIAIGGGLASILTIILGWPLSDWVVTAGALTFMVGVVLSIISIILI